MPEINGFVEVESAEIKSLCEFAINNVKSKRKKIFAEWVENVKESAKKPKFFGLISGKELTTEEAEHIVKKDEHYSYDCKLYYQGVIDIAEELIFSAAANKSVLVNVKTFRIIKSWAE